MKFPSVSSICSPRSDPSEHHFTGKERDPESNLDYFPARYYNSNFGRWMSPDPSALDYADPTNPQTLNLYSYVLNNPLTNIDPTGLDCVTDNGDGTVGTNTGDCANENEEAANHEYYINCDGCTSGAAGTNLDQATGSLYLTDSNGSGIAGATAEGFADAQGTPATDVSVNGSAPYLDTISGFGIVPDIDSQRIQQIALGVINFGIPNVCSFGLNARLGAGRVSVGADLSTNRGLPPVAGVRVASTRPYVTTSLRRISRASLLPPFRAVAKEGTVKSNPVRWALLTLAGVVGVVLTWFGLMDSAFSQPGQPNRVAVTLVWLLPLLSLPALITYSLWKRMPPAVFWVLLLSQWVSLSWINWDSALHGQSTTSNPVLLALSGGAAFPVWCWTIIAALCQYEHRLRPRIEAL